MHLGSSISICSMKIKKKTYHDTKINISKNIPLGILLPFPMLSMLSFPEVAEFPAKDTDKPHLPRAIQNHGGCRMMANMEAKNT